GESVGGEDGGAVVGDGQCQTQGGPAPVQQYRARPALPVIAALLRGGDRELLAQYVEQGGPGVDLDRPGLPVDGQADLCAHRTASRPGTSIPSTNAAGRLRPATSVPACGVRRTPPPRYQRGVAGWRNRRTTGRIRRASDP